MSAHQILHRGRAYPVQSWELRDGKVVRPWFGEKVVTIATVNERLEDHEDRNCSLDEAELNGQILAAAPDMFIALKDLLSNIDHRESDDGKPDCWCTDTGVDNTTLVCEACKARALIESIGVR